MNMITKTWKIGEYAKGGVITIEIKNNREIKIIGKIWDMSAGSTKSSNQSKAKPFISKTEDIYSKDWDWNLNEFLNDLTTWYYADQIMTWIKSKL